MYKLLLVDDEEDIRQGIASSIPWGDWGFEICGQASNGLEAVECIRENTPHVVLTDIRMPKMDGVALMQYLSKNYPEIKIIILTGYNDVEYLNMAIKNGVSEYLLKPTNLDEFERLFLQMKVRLDEETNRRREYEELKRSVEENNVYMCVRFLNQLICGHFASSEGVESKADFYKLGIDFNNCVVTLLEVDDLSAMEVDLPEEMGYDLRSHVTDFCNKALGEVSGRFFLNAKEEIIGIFCPEGSAWEQSAAALLSSIQSQLNEQLHITVSAGISDLCQDVVSLPRYYEQAEECIRQKIFMGPGSLLLYSHVKGQEEDVYHSLQFDQELITGSMLRGDLHAIREELDSVFGFFEHKVIKQYDYINRMCLEFLYNMSRWGLSVHINLDELLMDQGIAYSNIRAMDSLEAKKSFVYHILLTLFEKLKENKGGGNQLVNSIREYIDENYTSNAISLDFIADKVNKNPAYISKLFKNETGYNFSDYVAKKRVEKSKELLRDPALKVYDVAEQVGYADVSNFIRVFKKHTGSNPAEYRNHPGASGSES